MDVFVKIRLQIHGAPTENIVAPLRFEEFVASVIRCYNGFRLGDQIVQIRSVNLRFKYKPRDGPELSIKDQTSWLEARTSRVLVKVFIVPFLMPENHEGQARGEDRLNRRREENLEGGLPNPQAAGGDNDGNREMGWGRNEDNDDAEVSSNDDDDQEVPPANEDIAAGNFVNAAPPQNLEMPNFAPPVYPPNPPNVVRHPDQNVGDNHERGRQNDEFVWDDYQERPFHGPIQRPFMRGWIGARLNRADYAAFANAAADTPHVHQQEDHRHQ